MSDRGPCPDENELTSLVEGRLSGDALERLESHVDACATCSALLAEIAVVLAPSESTPPPALGRYQLVGELGSGAQGVVHEAYDRELSRRVALKRLRPDLAITTPSLVADARARLLLEARTLAGLSHPNVVALFDVHLEGEDVVLVQELVLGRSVDAWLLAESPSPHAILGVFAQAARGLSAAHAAGVVHRDVKPSNLLLGHDGRVRVTDFGLARSDVRDVTLTKTGATVGTPAYMAPEQLAGRAADARSDQYSLALALAEALFGERPLPGATVEDLEAARRERGLAEVPAGATRALARALSARPADRFNDLAELEAALHPDAPAEVRAVTLRPASSDSQTASSEAPSSRRRLAVGAIALLTLSGVAWGALSLGKSREPERAASSASAPVASSEGPTASPPPEPPASAGPLVSAQVPTNGGPSVASQGPDRAVPGGTAGPADPAHLLLKARGARDQGNPAGCVQGHDVLAAADPAFAARPGIQKERAECEMLAGQCTGGRKRMRGLLAGAYAAGDLDDAVDAVTIGSCPKGAGKRAPKATVSVEDARALFSEAQAASQAGDVAKCRRVGLDATRLAEPGQPIEVSSMLGGAIALTNDCLSKNGDCATARKNFVAQYPKLYPQLVAGGLDEAQRDSMFDASYPHCKKSP
jgi:serine/threonine protein kinase